MPERFRFLVDEAALRQAAGRGAIELSEAFDGLVRLIQEVRAHRIGKLSDVWEEQLGQHCLCDWLFDRALGIDRDTATALQVALDRTPDWDVAWDTAGLSKQVIVAGVEQEALSASAAARETREGRATACLSVVPSRSGRLRVTSPEHSAELHFIALSNDEVPVLAFFRDVPEVEKLDEDAYFDNAQFAFPNINFVRDRTRFGHFNEGYDTIRAKVTAHLSVLNDHAHAILGAKEPPDTKKARFGSHGVEASGENANTKGDSKAMKQREVTVAGRVVVCDWHTKLRPHVDRIYFNATSLAYVVVGVFRDHLD